MNIFVLDTDIEICAQYHCDKHVIKMILESAQILSTTLRLHNLDLGYKITHQNHPCTKWVRESLSNYMWLKSLTFFLNEEYKFRYGATKSHKSFETIKDFPLPPIEDRGLTPFAQAMPEEYKCDDAVLAYRTYYLIEKAHLLTYTKRTPPQWLYHPN